MASPFLPLVLSNAWSSIVNCFNGERSRQVQLDIMRDNHKFQEIENARNRQTQVDIAQDNRQFQGIENALNRQTQLDIEKERHVTQFMLSYLNIAHQQKLAEAGHRVSQDIAKANRDFHEKIVKYQLKENQKLQTFIKFVDIALAKDNQEFQAWMFKQQRALQTELATYNRESQLIIAAYQRESTLQLFDKQKESQLEVAAIQRKTQLEVAAIQHDAQLDAAAYQRDTQFQLIILNNWPLKLLPSEIIGSHVSTPVPVRVVLAPPEIDYDKYGKKAQPPLKIEEKTLAQGVRDFLERHYSLHSERATEFLGESWDSKRFSAETSIKRLFNMLKSEPTLVIESEVDGNYIHIRVAYWGGGQEIYTYKTVFSKLPYREIITRFAKAKMAKQGLTGEIKSDDQDLSQFLITCHRLLVGLFTDAHYLIYHNLSPQLPSLLSKVIKEIPDQQIAREMLQWVIGGYQEVFSSVTDYRSQWIPDWYMVLAMGLAQLSDKSLAISQLKHSIRCWLEQRGMETPPENAPLEAWGLAMKPMLVTAEQSYMKNMGDCVARIVF